MSFALGSLLFDINIVSSTQLIWHLPRITFHIPLCTVRLCCFKNVCCEYFIVCVFNSVVEFYI